MGAKYVEIVYLLNYLCEWILDILYMDELRIWSHREDLNDEDTLC